MRYLSTYATLVFGTLLASAPAGAQALNFRSIGVGLKGGLNIANVSDEDFDSRMGLAIGGQAEFGVTSPFSLVLEPGYLQRGAKEETVLGDSTWKLDYMEIPILLKAKFGSIQTAHAYAFVGPSLGFNLKSEVEVNDETMDRDANYFNISGDLGVGGAYRVSEFVYLSADARYSMGFTDATDDEKVELFDWMNRDIRISLGVLFHLIQ